MIMKVHRREFRLWAFFVFLGFFGGVALVVLMCALVVWGAALVVSACALVVWGVFSRFDVHFCVSVKGSTP